MTSHRNSHQHDPRRRRHHSPPLPHQYTYGSTGPAAHRQYSYAQGSPAVAGPSRLREDDWEPLGENDVIYNDDYYHGYDQ